MPYSAALTKTEKTITVLYSKPTNHNSQTNLQFCLVNSILTQQADMITRKVYGRQLRWTNDIKRRRLQHPKRPHRQVFTARCVPLEVHCGSVLRMASCEERLFAQNFTVSAGQLQWMPCNPVISHWKATHIAHPSAQVLKRPALQASILSTSMTVCTQPVVSATFTP